MMLEQKMEVKILAGIILAAFILSLGYSFYFRITPAVDAAAYDRIAWNLVQGNGYKERAELSYEKDLAIMRVGPGYELFLAAIYFLFGRHYEAAWIINALLHALSALLVFLIAKEIFKEAGGFFIGAVASAFIAFSPDLITMSGMLMTETLGVFLITLSIYLFWRYVNGVAKSAGLLFFTALVFGFAVMVRTPAALLFLPFAYYFIRENNWKHFLIFTVILILLFMPWIVRNYYVYRAFIPTNLAFGYDLLAGNHPGATGELEPYAVNDEFMSHGRIEGNKMALKAALGFILANPAEFSRITLDRISIYFSFARPTGFWFHLHGFAKA
ncbi:MAG: glycosyltransferase family 39 protein, partial [Candidatus Niyogibacteria bacterium]|nr:glycosyltransferase family 39 protein [Candidatus Niyogibacteria bacterium]